ncbi:hypothetical protein BAUCODRAFT_135901 [Baudoinia panamericana UAMH 10762]|uniref:BIR-domain-containing protein n=1 Tax=Baudoinia panamericana (strain UAMH 10762) TaxID=717646 RepID=M2NAC4_BAUPA|nr:uncharacterized protein BAUCODRAFT_135901 [Baudoinia panamericana UAMH 10762]EMD01174.1 hypothetical protein BAUCODRAFT_135901 [Baudoinia panamericana UAMH 10762]
MASSAEMQSFAARLATFQTPHQLSKRRASSQSSKKKGGNGNGNSNSNSNSNTVEWPHNEPAVEELARAGFFYRPAPDSPDNVQCFLCTVKLDGWEPTDSPLTEHLSHSPSCAWALSLSVAFPTVDEEFRDPLSAELSAARKGTFEAGAGWVHEDKRGWRCKVGKMVEAGWCFDPSPDSEDGATCFYCNLSLDGWEPKDDPLEEHKRRSPECHFFALCERYHGVGAATTMTTTGVKMKGKKGKARGSVASRVSSQSVVSIMSDAPGELSDVGTAAMDDSVMSTATTASQATVKGRKKAVGGPVKGKKQANKQIDDPPAAPDVRSPELSQSRKSQLPGSFPDSSILSPPPQQAPDPVVPAKTTRKNGGRPSKQTDSSVIETSQMDVPPKKPTRGRKAKAQPAPEPQHEPEASVNRRFGEASAQLQRELEDSLTCPDADAPDHESTPRPAAAPVVVKGKRGVKRSSDGMTKELQLQQQDFAVAAPAGGVGAARLSAPDDAAAAAAAADVVVPPKRKRGRPSRQSLLAEAEITSEPVGVTVDVDENVDVGEEIVVVHSSPPAFVPPAVAAAEEAAQREMEVEAEKPKKASKTKKAPAKKGKGKKTSSARSSKATIVASEPELDPWQENERDLEAEEAEIEAELARMANEQAEQAVIIGAEQERVEEYEPSPSQGQRGGRPELDKLVAQAEADGLIAAKDEAEEVAPSPAMALTKQATPTLTPALTPSPNGSDKENHPSSHTHPTTALKPATTILSPIKRIPLALGTPNRTLTAKHPLLLSPAKQPLHLTSTNPWTAIDLETVLMASPQPTTPGSLAQRLLQAGGMLTEREKGMSVEEWVRWRAGEGERELRRRCEGLVGVLEREGVRAVEAVAGIGGL